MSNAKIGVAKLSVISNSSLVVAKLVVGVLIGSVSVISEAIHSGVDLIAAIIALYAVKKSSIPADRDHPFGHGKIENISGTIEAILIFVAAIWIIYESVEKLLHPTPLKETTFGIAVMLVSCVVNIFVSGKLFKIGKQTESVALQADAWHLRTDVYTSLGVMVALLLVFIGKKVAPTTNLDFIDPIGAICVAFMIIKAAWDLTRDSAKDLVDVALPEEEIRCVEEIIKKYDLVCGHHKLCTRKSGSDRFVEFHMFVDEDMSVGDSHKITDDISKEIKGCLSGCVVTIHVEPSKNQKSP